MNILNVRSLLPWSIHTNTTDRNCRSNCIDEEQTTRYLASFFLSLESQFIHLESKFGIQCEWKMKKKKTNDLFCVRECTNILECFFGW